MKTGSINNFCDTSLLDVSAGIHPSCGPLVTINQNSGSCHFQHSMTAKQARELIAALSEGLGELERLAIQEAVTAMACVDAA